MVSKKYILDQTFGRRWPSPCGHFHFKMLPIEVGRTNAPFSLKSFHKNSGNIGSDMAQILTLRSSSWKCIKQMEKSKIHGKIYNKSDGKKSSWTSEYTWEPCMGGGRPPRSSMHVSNCAGSRERRVRLMDLWVSKEIAKLGGPAKTRNRNWKGCVCLAMYDSLWPHRQ